MPIPLLVYGLAVLSALPAPYASVAVVGAHEFADTAMVELAGAAVTDDGSSPGADEVEAASQVKDRHEQALMAVPGVVGMGIGLSRDGQRVVIQVYVAALSAETREALPSELDGVSVEIVETGEFRAL